MYSKEYARINVEGLDIEVDIKAIAGNYISVGRFKAFWDEVKEKELDSIIDYDSFVNEKKYVKLIDELLEGQQTKFLDVKYAEELEKKVILGTRSTKRTRQIRNALGNLKNIIISRGGEYAFAELMWKFERYEEYVNFDEEIHIVLNISYEHEGMWNIKRLYML